MNAQVQEVDRLRRTGIGRPRQLQGRVEVQRHQRDARELFGGDVRAASAATLPSAGRRLRGAGDAKSGDCRSANRSTDQKLPSIHGFPSPGNAAGLYVRRARRAGGA
jgi:hypothetical protein